MSYPGGGGRTHLCRHGCGSLREAAAGKATRRSAVPLPVPYFEADLFHRRWKLVLKFKGALSRDFYQSNLVPVGTVKYLTSTSHLTSTKSLIF